MDAGLFIQMNERAGHLDLSVQHSAHLLPLVMLDSAKCHPQGGRRQGNRGNPQFKAVTANGHTCINLLLLNQHSVHFLVTRSLLLAGPYKASP